MLTINYLGSLCIGLSPRQSCALSVRWASGSAEETVSGGGSTWWYWQWTNVTMCVMAVIFISGLCHHILPKGEIDFTLGHCTFSYMSYLCFNLLMGRKEHYILGIISDFIVRSVCFCFFLFCFVVFCIKDGVFTDFFV